MLRLCVIALLVFSALGCSQASSRDADRTYEQQLAETEKQIERGNKLLDSQDEQNERFDRLLDKWEEQARRQDAIIAAQEKQLGIDK